jgi:hypothetical protein
MVGNSTQIKGRWANDRLRDIAEIVVRQHPTAPRFISIGMVGYQYQQRTSFVKMPQQPSVHPMPVFFHPHMQGKVCDGDVLKVDITP